MIYRVSKSVLRWSQTCTDVSRHQTVHERYVCVLRIVMFLIVCNFQKIDMLVHIFLCSEDASTGCIGFVHVRNSILSPPNRKESLLRRSHAPWSLCSEDASMGHCISYMFVILYYCAPTVRNQYYGEHTRPDRCVVKMRPAGA